MIQGYGTDMILYSLSFKVKSSRLDCFHNISGKTISRIKNESNVLQGVILKFLNRLVYVLMSKDLKKILNIKSVSLLLKENRFKVSTLSAICDELFVFLCANTINGAPHKLRPL